VLQSLLVNFLQCAAVSDPKHVSVLQSLAACCSVLQRVAACCRVLQRIAMTMGPEACRVRRVRGEAPRAHMLPRLGEGGALQHAATRCNTLQHAARLCNTLQHAATRCNTLQHAATQHSTYATTQPYNL